jgi:hypothetical protein
MNPDGYVDSAPDEYTLLTVNKAREKVLVCLLSLSENLKNASCVREFCTAVYNLLQDIKRVSGKNNFYDGADGVSRALLYECLDSFVSFAGDEKITLSPYVPTFADEENVCEPPTTGRLSKSRSFTG